MIMNSQGFANTVDVKLVNGDILSFKKESAPWFIGIKGCLLEVVSNAQNNIKIHEDGNHELVIERCYIPLAQIKTIRTTES